MNRGGSVPTARAITRVSRYDEWHAVLTAGVIVFAVLVSILFGIWLASVKAESESIVRGHPWPDDERMITDVSSDLDFIEPGFSEMPEARTPDMKLSLVAVTDAASTVAASDLVRLGEQNDGDGIFGGGDGDERLPGLDLLPEWERWKIEYVPESKDEYFRMLDFFNVYLGAVRQKSNQILFLDNLSDSESSTSEGTRSSEMAKCIYFRNLKSRLKLWDQSKLRNAGVDLENTIVVQFYPEQTRQILLDLESAKMVDDGKQLKDIQLARFGCRKVDTGFKYYIEEISYKAGQ